jgi:hypothetical protein
MLIEKRAGSGNRRKVKFQSTKQQTLLLKTGTEQDYYIAFCFLKCYCYGIHTVLEKMYKYQLCWYGTSNKPSIKKAIC